MANTKNILLGIGGMATAIGLGIWLVNRYGSEETTTSTITGGLGNGGTPTGSSGGVLGNTQPKSFELNVILKRGAGYTSNNREVKELQRMLNAIQPQNQIAKDGLFGPKTEAKLLAVTGLNQTSLGQMKTIYYYI